MKYKHNKIVCIHCICYLGSSQYDRALEACLIDWGGFDKVHAATLYKAIRPTWIIYQGRISDGCLPLVDIGLSIAFVMMSGNVI